jgi:hypothetical protein
MALIRKDIFRPLKDLNSSAEKNFVGKEGYGEFEVAYSPFKIEETILAPPLLQSQCCSFEASFRNSLVRRT